MAALPTSQKLIPGKKNPYSCIEQTVASGCWNVCCLGLCSGQGCGGWSSGRLCLPSQHPSLPGNDLPQGPAPHPASQASRISSLLPHTQHSFRPQPGQAPFLSSTKFISFLLYELHTCFLLVAKESPKVVISRTTLR